MKRLVVITCLGSLLGCRQVIRDPQGHVLRLTTTWHHPWPPQVLGVRGHERTSGLLRKAEESRFGGSDEFANNVDPFTLTISHPIPKEFQRITA
jgi:hypothetical protein